MKLKLMDGSCTYAADLMGIVLLVAPQLSAARQLYVLFTSYY
jgi:hypothetical protein